MLIPFTGLWNGASTAGAAELAVQQVNANETLLPGRVLEYIWRDSGCSPKQGLDAMGQVLRNYQDISAVIGPGCRHARTHAPTHPHARACTLGIVLTQLREAQFNLKIQID